MKRKILVIATTLLISFMSITGSVQAKDINTSFLKARATAYCLSGKTASGEEVREGICAGKKEWLGKTIYIYKRLPDDSIGDLIGIYECLDTGGTKAIRNGKVVDIWCEDYSSCKEFMNLVYEDDCAGKIYIQVIDAVG